MNNHPKLNIAFQAAIGLILLRLLAFMLNGNPQFVDTGFLFISLAALIPLSIYAIWPRGQNNSFLREVNASMRITTLFGLIITVFLFLFYQCLETEYFELTREQIINRELKNYETTNGSPMPQEDSVKLKDNITSFFSIRNYTAIVLVLFIILSAFYAALFSALKKLLIQTKSS